MPAWLGFPYEVRPRRSRLRIMRLFFIASSFLVLASTSVEPRHVGIQEFELLEQLEVQIHKTDRAIESMKEYYDGTSNKFERVYLRGFELMLKNLRAKINRSIAHLENYEQDELTSEEKSRFPNKPITRRYTGDSNGPPEMLEAGMELMFDWKNTVFQALLRALKTKIEKTALRED